MQSLWITSLFVTSTYFLMVAHDVQGQEQNLGRSIGVLDQRQAAFVQGDVYAASADTILIDGFTFSPVQGAGQLGDVFISPSLDLPAEVSLGQLGLNPIVHDVYADDVIILNTKQLRLVNFSYDGLAPDVYFWVGTGMLPSSGGQRILDENGVIDEPLSEYNGETIIITFPNTLTVFNVSYLSIWCERFAVDFGHVMIPAITDPLSIPVFLDEVSDPTRPEPKVFENCQELERDKFHVAWAVDSQRGVICIQLRGKVDLEEYMAFGVSGSPISTSMLGSDVTVGWIDAATMQANAVDYFLQNYIPCSVTQALGACPDVIFGGTDDVTLIDHEMRDGVTYITYERPLNPTVDSIRSDLSIPLDQPVFISWAYGQINDVGLVTRHETRTPGNVQINFGMASSSCPDFTPEMTTQPAVPWSIPPIVSLTPNFFSATIGPSGGLRGVQGITGIVGWGIAWYINNAIIPEITVSRGVQYTFVVNGGDDPTTPALNHPFYITSSESGGYSQLTPAQQQLETIYAGPQSGPLCEWKTTADPIDHPNFNTYQETLNLECIPSTVQSGFLQWTPDNNTPDLVYYQCYTHQYLGWKINVVGEAPAQPCDSQRCQNGGICTNIGSTSFFCNCAGTGFTGATCEIGQQFLPCDTQPCLNGGTCTNFGTQFQCACPTGFSGSTCAIREVSHACDSQPCLNGGFCTNLGTKFLCDCPTGFSGRTCSVGTFLPCDAQPCLNGGACTNLGTQFQCACPTGFSGPTCSIREVLPCDAQPCQNGGTCTNFGTRFQCACPAGFSGPTCSIGQFLPCDVQPCLNGGTCTNLGTTFQCACPTGFSGQICSIPQVLPCNTQPCLNGGTCTNFGTQFQCTCPTGFSGPTCSIRQVLPCDSQPCLNGGTCTNLGTTFQCACPTGFSGSTCAVLQVLPCDAQPCLNGGSCTNFGTRFQCACPTGFSGPTCSIRQILPCDMQPCLNGGSCTNFGTQFQCACPTRFSGPTCSILEVLPCDSQPCLNGGTCTNFGTTFQCDCAMGFTGPTCSDVFFVPCDVQPCRNGGTCENVGSRFRCLCRPRFTGVNCEIAVSTPCDLEPCQNGGTCFFFGGSLIRCLCRESFTGQRCENAPSPCASVSCLNGGTCTVEGGVATCQCTAQFTGSMCERMVTATLPCDLEPCRNGGVCENSGVNFICNCQPGFTGPACGGVVLPCDSSPCMNGGVCLSTSNGGGFSCNCPSNFVGLRCEESVGPCGSQPCLNGGTCLTNPTAPNGFTCECTNTAFFGTFCETVNLCLANPCENGGLCQQSQNRVTCDCSGTGFTGPVCTQPVVVDPPTSSLTATCPDDICMVPPGRMLFVQVTWEDPVISGGVGQVRRLRGPAVNSAFYQAGTGGVVTYQFSDSANNFAECDFRITVMADCQQSTSPPVVQNCPSDISRALDQGFTSVFVDWDDLNVSGDNVQQIAGPLVSSGRFSLGDTTVEYIFLDGSGRTVTCTFTVMVTQVDPGSIFITCPSDIDVTVLRGVGGSIVSYDLPVIRDDSFILVNSQRPPGSFFRIGSSPISYAYLGRAGEFEQCAFTITVNEVSPCDTPSCQNGGTCIPLTLTDFICACPGCFRGDQCENVVNACDGNQCQNGGTCQPFIGSCEQYFCECPPCFSGIFCELLNNPCDSETSCGNGAVCSPSGTDCSQFTCQCQGCFSGPLCDQDFNPCLNNPCQNGGICQPLQDSCTLYTCACQGCFTGFNCEIPFDPCQNQPCLNGGTCRNDPTSCNSYSCDCVQCFAGFQCELSIANPCVGSPCLNGGTCLQTGDSCTSFLCMCDEGFGGPLCQTVSQVIINPCISQPCKNGASCLFIVNGYHCICRTGYRGNNCEAGIDGIFFQTSCLDGICQNGGTCYDSYTSTQPFGTFFQYTCMCAPGFTGQACSLQLVQATRFDACSSQGPDYCRNNGVCLNAFVSISLSVIPACDCQPGFAGQFCDFNVENPCIVNPCRNNGQCLDFGRYFICNCVQPYAGETCESLQVDRTPPDIMDCPTQGIIVRTTQTHAVVNWVEPTATDDSQFPVRLVSANAAPGALYPVGTTLRVFYNFEDLAGNAASCSFIIQVL